jgi:hypothetical protein
MSDHRPRLTVIEGGPAAARPPLELAALGTGLVLVVALMARLPSWRAELGTFQSLFAAAFAFYALALMRRGRSRGTRHGALTVLVVAAAARLALLPVAPTLSDDVYRYVWEGRVAAAGCDPWRHSPDDPALAHLRDDTIHPRVNHPQLASIYPPLAVAGFALVARISPTVSAFKVWVVLHDLALVALLLAWARRRGGDPTAVLIYAWNPLVLVEYAGTGHADPTAMVWLVAALALAQARPVASALAAAAGALVKLAPLAALPALGRAWTWRARVTALAVLVVGLAPLLATAGSRASGLTAWASWWRNNDLVFAGLAALAGEPVARAIVLAAVAASAFLFARRREPADATRATLKTALLLSPVLHPWYLGWVLALEPVRAAPGESWRGAPWTLLSLTAILSYGLLAPPSEGGAYHLPIAWRALEYGAPAALALALWLRRRRS